MKKHLTLLVLLILVCAALVACGDSSTEHQHACVAVSGTPASCTDDGVVDHYRCDGCGKLFSDADGNNEITSTAISALGHTGGEATCKSKATCSRCSQQYGELKAHSFGAFEQTTAPTCTTVGVSTAVCTACGDEKTEEIAALGHSGEWNVVAEPRCFDNGEEQLICTTCDTLVERSIPSFESHDLQDSTCVGGKQCARCNYTEGSGNGHAFDDWKITKSANCTQDGTKERACLVCGYKENGVVIRTGHTGDWSCITEPTCTENGEEGRMCTSCSHYETRIAYKKGHSGEWNVTTEATCTASGEKQRTCTACGNVEKTIIPKGHTYGDWWTASEPTCTENGLQSRNCLKCGSRQDSNISKTGHSMSWQITKEPTCTENGVKVGTCTVCGQNENATAEKLGHNLQGGTCVEPSACTRCGYAVMNTHIYGAAYEIIGPDCERHGIMNEKCTVCGYVNQYTTSPVGHTFADWEMRLAPTCTMLGKERRVCTVCTKAEDRDVQMEEHSASDWIIIDAADCLNDGLKNKVCTVCSIVITEETITALGHDFADATCTAPQTCTRCSLTEGERLAAHTLESGDWGLTCTSCGSLLLTDRYLVFTLSSDGNSYWITGTTYDYSSSFYNDSTFSGIIFPDTYEGKPVTALKAEGDAYPIAIYHENIFIPKTVEMIGERAFESVYFKHVYFESESKLKSIGSSAFNGCRNLISIDLPEGLLEIKENAFSSCYKLENVILPSTLETIEYGAFAYCGELTSVRFPEKLKFLGADSFIYCEKLVSVVLPGGSCDISTSAFTYSKNIEPTVTKNGLKYLGTTENPYLFLFGADENITSAVVEKGCVYIGARAFAGCSQLKHLVLQDGVKAVGYSATFESPLESIMVCATLESYDGYAFGGDRDTVMYFCGSYEQWKNVKEPNLTGNTHLFRGRLCCYSDVYVESNHENNWCEFWHYDENGDRVIWTYS